MKWSGHVTLATLVLLALVGWWEWSYNSSPGALDPPHDKVPGFREPGGCALCHPGSAKLKVDACAQCHGFIRSQIDARHGLHGIIEPQLAMECGKCHAEHNAGRVRLVNDKSFEISGFPDLDSFDHSRIAKYTLTGKHEHLRCDRCHRDAYAVELPAAHKRFVGLSQQCVSCHEDFHKGAYGTECASCHAQSRAFNDSPRKPDPS
jgi:hypothetical protein